MVSIVFASLLVAMKQYLGDAMLSLTSITTLLLSLLLLVVSAAL